MASGDVGDKTKLLHIISGLTILHKYCGDDVQITESGGGLDVWNYYGSKIVVGEPDLTELLRLGWVDRFDENWWFPLSG